MEEIENYCNKWKIKINPKKSPAIHVTRTRKVPPRLYINNKIANWVKKLGALESK